MKKQSIGSCGNFGGISWKSINQCNHLGILKDK